MRNNLVKPGGTAGGVDKTGLEKSKVHIVVDILEYIPKTVVSKTIIKKITGNITVTYFGAGKELAEKTLPFDTFVQIIDGDAEVLNNDKVYKLKLGEGIIIPAYSKHCINANEQFKMSTIIKAGMKRRRSYILIFINLN